MGSLRADMKKYFQTENLYDLLSVNKKATEKEIKRAYYVLSQQVHPDKVPAEEKETATSRFQVVGKVYSVLSDPEKRKIYDETGVADEDLVSSISDWMQYFRSMFKKIEVQDIDDFKKEYVGSEEEKGDVKKLYERFEGDMNTIMQHLFFYEFDREDEYREIIAEAIKYKEVTGKYKATFLKESADSIKKRKQKVQREAKAVEKEAAKQQKANGSGDMDLVKMIQQNQEKRGRNFVDELEAKFTGPAAKKGKNINKKSKTLESKKSAQPKDEGSSGSDWGGLSGDDVGKSGSEEEVKPKAAKKSPARAAPKRRKV